MPAPISLETLAPKNQHVRRDVKKATTLFWLHYTTLLWRHSPFLRRLRHCHLTTTFFGKRDSVWNITSNKTMCEISPVTRNCVKYHQFSTGSKKSGQLLLNTSCSAQYQSAIGQDIVLARHCHIIMAALTSDMTFTVITYFSLTLPQPTGYCMYRQWSVYVPPVVTVCTAQWSLYVLPV